MTKRAIAAFPCALPPVPLPTHNKFRDSSADTSAEDFSKSIHERLKQILDLYKVSRYRSTPDGALAIDMDALVRGNQPRTAEYKPSGNGTLAGGKKGSAAGGAYSAYLKKGGAPGEQLEPNLFPEVKWVTVKDGTREPPYLDDRAANYLIDQNVLIINGDFRGRTNAAFSGCEEP